MDIKQISEMIQLACGLIKNNNFKNMSLSSLDVSLTVCVCV